ncbi:MAG: AAA family ATPase [Ruminococcus sp.]|nr:AAA family ATPase [Ruminococcus sp.]
MGFKTIPIGHENFKRIIDENHYYIDKTLMIKDLIDNNCAVNLFTRPRRFGKTLNMSMLRYFFENTDEDNSYLFKNLNISKAGDKYLSHMGQYPVISISLKSMKQNNFKNSFANFKYILSDEFSNHKEIIENKKIDTADREKFISILEEKADDTVYLNALKVLSKCLESAYEKRVIILIDEYDVPLESAYFNGYYDEMVNLIRSVFESALKTNDSIEFAVLTGCLRISKESIFTGLNNFDVYPITENAFSQYFGFTEDEVKQAVEFYNLEKYFPKIKQWYNGYKFGSTEIYNPWSVLKYLQSALNNDTARPEPYWSNTSSNDIIRQIIFEGDENIKYKIEELINGGHVTAPIYEDITYRNVKINSDYIWSFLLFTGYLKPIDFFKNEHHITCFKGVIPNIEISTIYRSTIMQWFEEKLNSTPRNELFDALLNEDTETIEDTLSDWLDETISYYDSKENYYHGFLTGMLTGFKGYTVKSNRESGDGRPDILIMERKKHLVAIIIEIKVADRFPHLSSKCDEALLQINEKRYDAELIEDGFKKIIKYGISFNGKACMVKKEI